MWLVLKRERKIEKSVFLMKSSRIGGMIHHKQVCSLNGLVQSLTKRVFVSIKFPQCVSQCVEFNEYRVLSVDSEYFRGNRYGSEAVYPMVAEMHSPEADSTVYWR